MIRRQWLVLIATILVTGATLMATERDASACGGFFCDNNQPVNQAAERIIFSDNPDGTVTAVVQILYQGPAQEFAWVLPVPSVPDVAVSSNAAFTALQGRTNPQYILNTRVEGECKPEDFLNNATSANNGGAVDAGAGETNNGGDVGVLAQGNVGPYNYAVIEVDPAASDKVQAAITWLEENGYDVTDLGPDVIEPYLDEGMKLIAFKLSKTSDAGDIRPIMITYDAEVPSIPIKLTAVAANDDMGVMVWILGEHRSVPVNYKDLKLNDAVINWFNPGSNYNDVVTLAANEAMGHGFVTEFANPTSTLSEVIYSENDRQMWEQDFQGVDWTGNEQQLVEQAWDRYTQRFGNGGFVPWDGWPEVVDAAFPRLTADEKDALTQCAPCAFRDGFQMPSDFSVDTFLTAMADFVITPMEETQALIDDHPYVTRMYTTLSASEMTVDPIFDFNPDLGDHDNVHNADRIIECNPEVYRFEAPWRVELPSGNVVRGEGGGWPLAPGDDLPANESISQASTSGEGEVVTDNTQTIRQALEAHNETIAPGGSGSGSGSGGDLDGDGDGDKPSPGCGCNSSAGGFASSTLLLIAAFLLVRVRRREV